MTINLRDRRRQQTAREIQLAALRLSLRTGYGAVTTDLIAAEAGISPRTFFNYYHNKQAAILGEAPDMDCDCADWIVTSQQPLSRDLARLMASLLEQKHMDREVVRMLGQIWNTTPELMALFRASMDNIARALGGLLERRLGAGHEAEAMLMAELATHALSHAVRAWAEDETMSLTEIPVMVERHLNGIGALLR
ncbi:TetR/AcrR family transcriptional regulator [Paracoccus nototheniae]|uniref:TetR/AcrR family transcriptional regulator n=1 Tax=Paracoccus nototheniae TaxID=2489002 RepID=A0ABW4E3J9_9RHOB|nr:TetR/AcrR family transcriptional regulator [Paracoccus nototheniae]